MPIKKFRRVIQEDFGSFYKNIAGTSEGKRCLYTERLDTYGCGCQHNCLYCYSKALLNFRLNWLPMPPAAKFNKIEKILIKTKQNKIPIRLGGMTDCFMPQELYKKNTKIVLQLLKKYKKPYIIVSKSDLVAEDDYIKIMPKELAHIQITITSGRDEIGKEIEPNATSISRRIKAVEKLYNLGYDVSVRVSPLIPDEKYFNAKDIETINNIKCDKVLVEFLRINHFIKKWMPKLDTSKYKIKQGGYEHIELETKLEYIKKFKGKNLSVCEDVDEHYRYFKENINKNKEDCCNLNYENGK